MISGASDSAIADWLEALLRTALTATSGVVAITVPGGATPFPILAELAGRDIDWPRVAVWPGDERIVGELDPASNVGRIRAALAQTGTRITPLEEDSRPPHFVLAWLGMGGDGHIASLFPSTDPRAEDPHLVRRLTPDPLPPEAPYERLTLTIPALLDSDALLFVIRGEAKRVLFEAAAAGRNDLPVARLLRAATQPVTCFT
ncbi:MAG: 6-phosphogluconolactonase [Novosphingobium sp.]